MKKQPPKKTTSKKSAHPQPSFYVVESSFFQGSAGWESIYVVNSPAAVKKAALECARGGWQPDMASDTFSVRVFQEGKLVANHDLYDHVRLKLPGFTELSFAKGRRAIGGLLEPGGDVENDDVDEGERWDMLWETIEELANESPDEIDVSFDWKAIALPKLTGRLVTRKDSVRVGKRSLNFGFNSSFAEEADDEG